jgi:hypothetical protein
MIDQSMSCRQPCGRVLSWALGHSVFVFFSFLFFQFCELGAGLTIIHKRNEPKLATGQTENYNKKFRILAWFWWALINMATSEKKIPSKYGDFGFFFFSLFPQRNPLYPSHWILWPQCGILPQTKALLGLSQKTVTRLQSFKIDPGDANCSSLQVAAKLTLWGTQQLICSAVSQSQDQNCAVTSTDGFVRSFVGTSRTDSVLFCKNYGKQLVNRIKVFMGKKKRHYSSLL